MRAHLRVRVTQRASKIALAVAAHELVFGMCGDEFGLQVIIVILVHQRDPGVDLQAVARRQLARYRQRIKALHDGRHFVVALTRFGPVEACAHIGVIGLFAAHTQAPKYPLDAFIGGTGQQTLNAPFVVKFTGAGRPALEHQVIVVNVECALYVSPPSAWGRAPPATHRPSE